MQTHLNIHAVQCIQHCLRHMSVHMTGSNQTSMPSCRASHICEQPLVEDEDQPGLSILGITQAVPHALLAISCQGLPHSLAASLYAIDHWQLGQSGPSELIAELSTTVIWLCFSLHEQI